MPSGPPRKIDQSREYAQFSLNWLIPVAILFSVFAAYLPAIHGDFLWDDDYYVSKNPTLQTWGGLGRIWFEIGATPQYYPLVFTTFWAEYHLWGLTTTGYHIVNILLHAGSAFLLWRILRRLEVPGATAAALVFALHPVHVESVAWITERKNVLSGFLYLAALEAYLRFCPPRPDEPVQANWKWYSICLALFTAALLSKSVTATLPAAILLIYWWKRRVNVRLMATLAPMFVMGILAGALTAWVEKHHVGTKYLEWNLGLLERTLIAGRAVWFYVGKLVWPASLTFIYPRWQIDAHEIVAYLYPLAAIAVMLALFGMRGRWGRGPLVAALFFVGTLFPALGFIDVFPMRFSFVADHFQYLASIGLIVLACALAAAWLKGRQNVVTGAIASIVLGILTFRQCGIYSNQETLWRDTLAKNPRATIASINLGGVLQKQGRAKEAEGYFLQALQDPECLDRADVLRNLGLTAMARGDAVAAIGYYQKAIAERPDFATAHVNLGETLRRLGRTSEAISCFERAVEADPRNAVARNNLGSARFDAGRFDDAVAQFQTAIALSPEMAEGHYNLGNALARVKRERQAEAEYRVAIGISPNYAEARLNLANLMLQAGRVDEAIPQLESALRTQPDNPLAHYSFAYAMDRKGRTAAAAEHFKRAQQLKPDLRAPPGYANP